MYSGYRNPGGTYTGEWLDGFREELLPLVDGDLVAQHPGAEDVHGVGLLGPLDAGLPGQTQHVGVLSHPPEEYRILYAGVRLIGLPP